MPKKTIIKTNRNLKKINKHLSDKARKIKLVLTDNDGVLTDTGVYYSDQGEIYKRFSIRDGMGVERLRKELNIETGIISGEISGSIKKRAEKLKIKELLLGVSEKHLLLSEIQTRISEANIREVVFNGRTGVLFTFNVVSSGNIDDKCFFKIFQIGINCC